MYLKKIHVKNFRSLRDLDVDLEDYLSIIVGKNNSGKTSLLLILEKFLSGGNSARFELNDFNIELQQHLKGLIEDTVQPADPYPMCGIALRLFVEYGAGDDLANIGNKVIMDLDPDNRSVVLDFLYHLPSQNLALLKRDFKAHQDKKGDKAKDGLSYLKDVHGKYFTLARRSVQFDHLTGKVVEDNFTDLIKENIRIDDIISFKRVNARRTVSNKDSDRGLSALSAKIYTAMSADTGEEEVFETFKDALTRTDKDLDDIYAAIFHQVIDDVRQFGGIKEGDTEITIKSSLQHRDLLEENTTVVYGHGAERHELPESYNGLGYLNLISIIFEIKILLNEFKRGNFPKPADINLLFIEEPEAHTHPQMQAVFIKNIKNLIGRAIKNADRVERPLQTVLSTHSAHIVAESDFDDIKYFKRTAGNTTSHSLKYLERLYETTGYVGHYKFLKQYLTLHRSQLFFADKAILVEGDTERILLPSMMRKIDQVDAADAWVAGNSAPLALLSQNISVIEVGAHAHIFELFLDFIGVKTLIVTDIDSAAEQDVLDKAGKPVLNKDGKPRRRVQAHPIEGATHTTNAALKFFHGAGSDIGYFIGLSIEKKTLIKEPTRGWCPHVDGQVMCVFQVSEADKDGTAYHARSFEDAFFHVNRDFIRASVIDDGKTKKFKFPSLVDDALEAFLEPGSSSYAMAEDGITKKPSFAIEILLNSTTRKETRKHPDGTEREFVFEFSNWNIPQYIREGLAWIKLG
ncbi:ATP-dependent endonuclease [Labrys portucalensis]|uniref:ATP-dependent endonuclease n=1 Tax=Labrys neptuniae TaxID=376174 RepID=A0ABV6ZRE0_9HYPH